MLQMMDKKLCPSRFVYVLSVVLPDFLDDIVYHFFKRQRRTESIQSQWAFTANEKSDIELLKKLRFGLDGLSEMC